MENNNCNFCYSCNSCNYCKSCNFCNYCTSCDNCDYCNSCNYCDSCDYCNYCDSCYSCTYCNSCYSCKNLKMTEYNYFCWAERYKDENSVQQKPYRIFNTQVTKEEYEQVNKISHKLTFEPHESCETRFQT